MSGAGNVAGKHRRPPPALMLPQTAGIPNLGIGKTCQQFSQLHPTLWVQLAGYGGYSLGLVYSLLKGNTGTEQCAQAPIEVINRPMTKQIQGPEQAPRPAAALIIHNQHRPLRV